MRRQGLITLAAVALGSLVGGGLVVRPTMDRAFRWAENQVRERVVPTLERRLGGDLQIKGLDLRTPGQFAIESLTLGRDDGVRVTVRGVRGGWSIWSALLTGPKSAVRWSRARSVQVDAPSAATPLGRRVTLDDGDVTLNASADGWLVRGHARLRIGDGPALPVEVSGDTGGGIELLLPGGLAVKPPDSLGLSPGFDGLEAVISRVRLGRSPARAVATAVGLRGLPEGVAAQIDSVSIALGTRSGPSAPLEANIRGLTLSVDLDRLDVAALRSLAGRRPGSSTRLRRIDGPRDPDADHGAVPRAWSVVADDAELLVRSQGVDHRLKGLRLGVASEGTLELGLSVATGVITGNFGARLIPARAQGDGLSVAFDAWVDDGGINHPKISANPLSKIRVRALGLARWRPDADRLEVDLREATVGEARLSGRFVGVKLSDPRRARIGAAIDLPGQPCQALIDALPTGALTVLEGLRVEGRFEGGVELAFDMADLEESIVLAGRGDPRKCEVLSDGDHIELASLNRKDFVHHWPRLDGEGALAVGPGTRGYVALSKLPRHVIRSMVVTEDGRFWGHRGVNLSLIRKALKINLTKRGFVYGGSTITQQLMKNLFLTRRKTLARKVEEGLLAIAVERVVPKRRLMELYVNVIEFAPDVYGISKASRFYFSKSPTRLTPIEGAFLATIKPKPVAGPKLARRGRFKGWWHHRLIEVMRWLEEGGYISPLERARAFPYYPEFRGPVLSSARRAKSGKSRRRRAATPPHAPPQRAAALAAVGPPR